VEPTHLLLVRHGETDYNRYNIIQGTRDVPLNEIGRRQAEELSDKLSGVPIDAAYSSCLSRAFETANIIMKPHELSVKQYPELNEMHFGTYEGKRYKDVKHLWDVVHDAWNNGDIDRSFKDGENPLQVQDRADARMQSIIDQHPSETVLIVTHGRLMRILLSKWFDVGLTRMDEIAIPNTVVYHVRIDGDSIKPEMINDVSQIQEMFQSK